MDNIEIFYRHLINFVKEYPDCEDCQNCLRPHTFTVLRNLSELSAPSLGREPKDIDLPYFYSRIWEQKNFGANIIFDWSLVAIWETDINLKDAFKKNKMQKSIYSFDLAVLDMYNLNKEKGSIGCSGRTTDEIMKDTKTTLDQLIDYLSHSHYNDDGALIYDRENTTFSKFQKMLDENNENISTLRYDNIGTPSIIGSVIKLNIEVSNCVTYPTCDDR